VEKELFVRLLAGPIGRQLTHLALPGITQAEDPDCWYAYTDQGTRALLPATTSSARLVVHGSCMIGGLGAPDAAANEDIVASVLENCVSLRSLRLRESSFRNHDDAILSGTHISTTRTRTRTTAHTHAHIGAHSTLRSGAAKRPWACRELGKLVVDRGYGLTDVAVERIAEQLNTRLWHLKLRGPLPKITGNPRHTHSHAHDIRHTRHTNQQKRRG
jgi:hypothetical protein